VLDHVFGAGRHADAAFAAPGLAAIGVDGGALQIAARVTVTATSSI